MPVNPVHTDNAPAAIGAYSQATLAEGFLFTSGQLGLVPATGALAEGVEAQARQAFANLEAICAAAGTTLGNTVKMTIFLADINDFGAFNEVYGKYFISKPARSFISVVFPLPLGPKRPTIFPESTFRLMLSITFFV